MKKKLLLFSLLLLGLCLPAAAHTWTYNLEKDYNVSPWKNVKQGSDTQITCNGTNDSGSITTITWTSNSTTAGGKDGNAPKGVKYGSAASPADITFSTSGFDGKKISKVEVYIVSLSKKCRYDVDLEYGTFSGTQADVIYQDNSGAANTKGLATFTPEVEGAELSIRIHSTGTTSNTKGGFKLWEIAVTYEDDSETPDPVGAIDYAPVFGSMSVKTGETATLSPESDNAAGKVAPVLTYSSDSECVTIEGNTLTGVTAGTAAVTATWKAVADVWNAGSTTFEVVVSEGGDEPTPPVSDSYTYQLVTSADDLEAGTRYVVATGSGSSIVAMKKYVSGNNHGQVIGLTEADGILTINDEVEVLELEKVTDDGIDYWLWHPTQCDEGNYLVSSASANRLQVSKPTSANLHYTIVNFTNNNPYITFVKAGRDLKYNTSLFSTYTTTQTDVQLYKQVILSNDPIDYEPVYQDLNLSIGTEGVITLSDNASVLRPAPAVSYTVAPEDVVAIEGTAVKALKLGEATVTATWEAVEGKWNAGTASFKVSVVPDVYKPEYEPLTLIINDTAELGAKADNSTPEVAAPAVTYSLAAGSDVVSLEGNKVTALKGGTATVTAAWEADANWGAGTATIEVTVNKIPVTLTWNAASAVVELGKEADFVGPALTTDPAEAAAIVVYTSSNTEIASVDASGVVTPKAFGEVEITASVPEENAFYQAAPAAYRLSVLDPNILELTFDFNVKDAYGMTSMTGGTQLDDLSISYNGVSIDVKGKYQHHTSADHYDLRVYKDAVMDITAPAGKEIKRIEIGRTSNESDYPFAYTGAEGTFDASTGIFTINETSWAETVAFDASKGKVFIQSIKIEMAELPEASVPAIEILADGKTLHFKAQHSSHALWYKEEAYTAQENGGEESPIAPMDLAAEGWTLAEGGEHTHVADLDRAQENPYVVKVKSVDRLGRESGEAGFIVTKDGIITGVDEVLTDEDAAPEYFNLQGIRLNGAPEHGIYIRRAGNKVTKHIAR